LPSTMQSAQDRSDTSIPAKYSISHLPCSQSSCDLIGSSTSQQKAAQLRMLWAVIYGRTYWISAMLRVKESQSRGS
jgi:hypothetical protein